MKECERSAPADPDASSGCALGWCAVLFVTVVVSLRMGAYPISVRDIVITLFNGAVGRRDQIPSEFWLVVFGLRLPRIALGILVGAALSTAGAGFQALLRNPLAEPYVLGVSSGAALGAILSLIVAPHTAGAIQAAAFVGAAATIAAVYFLGRRGGQLDSGTLLLAGIVTASFLSAVIMFLMTILAARDLRGIAFWLMGDLASPPSVDTSLALLSGAADRGRIDLHNFLRPQSDPHGRARGAAPRREREPRENW